MFEPVGFFLIQFDFFIEMHCNQWLKGLWSCYVTKSRNNCDLRPDIHTIPYYSCKLNAKAW